MRSSSAFRYVLSAVILLILVALAWWYFFLRAREASIARENAGRGAEPSSQSFKSNIGSTYENIVSSFSTLVGGNNESTDGKTPQLLQVGKTPTAGMGFVGTGASVRLRFVERSTGYVLVVAPETGELSRLTNTLIPHMYEALFTKSGRVIMRSVDEAGGITTLVGSIAASSSASSATYSLLQKRLPSNIQSIAASPSGEEVFYIAEGSESAEGIRAAWDGTGQKELFSSALSGWKVRWVSKDRIIIAQRPSDDTAGYAYVVEESGATSALLRNIPGLTVLPHPSSPALLFGESAGHLSLFARIDEKTVPLLLPIRTIADKCVWGPGKQLVAFCAVPQQSPSADFLNTWYRGETHTADAWWRVDINANSAELLLAPGNTVLDVEDPIIDESGRYIAFINGIDKSLWLLRTSKE